MIFSFENSDNPPDLNLVGSKTRNLFLASNKGFNIPRSFCITTEAYKKFIEHNDLFSIIDREIYKKPFEEMRWEEMWDASLRIRSAFLRSEIPLEIELEIIKHIKEFGEDLKFSVRSSSPAEDSKKNSFAGIHESYTNVQGTDKILESIKLVWASLWSDRAILYREELKLDSLKSTIAVLMQIMEKPQVSGLAFSKDPNGDENNLIIEVVGGYLSNLVDNIKVGEKWVIQRDTHFIIQHIQPEETKKLTSTLLKSNELEYIINQTKNIEGAFGFPADIEWTGKGKKFTVLQVRPITSIVDSNEERKWYLTLTPNFDRLKQLSNKVETYLIPQLEIEGKKLALEKPQGMKKDILAVKIKERADIYFKWKKIYWDEFIPFAHGIRNFGTYYNDLVKPKNPYEFMELLKTDNLLASKRNKELISLSLLLKSDLELNSKIEYIINKKIKNKELLDALGEINEVEKFSEFVNKFKSLLNDHMDLMYENQSFKDHPELILINIWELSKKEPHIKEKLDLETVGKETSKNSQNKISKNIYMDKLYSAAGKSRLEEALEVLRIGKLSWKLRDDDNILLGKLENQLLIFLNHGCDILISENRIGSKENLILEDWKTIYDGLLDSKKTAISIKKKKIEFDTISKPDFKPRQLIGQPSSPGIVSGLARIINSFEDFYKFKSGEILVCDAIQPQMTFLVSLASGIVERRGGMLVHSSIIAREMGIPSVNGISKATQLINDGDLVTVNGYLGLVVIGSPEFELERHS
jgi:pyruvate,water dikinase